MLALALTIGVQVCLIHVPQDPAPTWRIHLRREGAAWKYVLFREEVCADLATLKERLKSAAPEGSAVVVQCEGDTPAPLVRELVQALGPQKGWQLQLAADVQHKDYLERIGIWLEEEKMLGFSGWLRGHYDRVHGARSTAEMWRDVERALLAGRGYLAINLIANLPRMKVASGAETEYVERSADVSLSDSAAQRFLEAIEAELRAGRHHGAKMFLDELGFVADRRMAAYLFAGIANEEWPFYVRSAAARTLQRLKAYDEVVISGNPQFWLMMFEDTPAAREELARGLAVLREWWGKVQAQFPAQLEPAAAKR